MPNSLTPTNLLVGGVVKAQFYSPIGLRGDHLVTLFYSDSGLYGVIHGMYGAFAAIREGAGSCIRQNCLTTILPGILLICFYGARAPDLAASPMIQQTASPFFQLAASPMFQQTLKTLHKTSDVSPGDVVINEFLYRPDHHGNQRFIELYNRSEKILDMRGWTVGRSTGNPVTVISETHAEPVYLMPKSKAVISEPGLHLPDPESIHLETNAFPAFSRFGDAVYLRSAGDTTIDSLFYRPEWGGNRDGTSIERVDPNGATPDSSNWRTHPEHHSAGQRNHHFNDALDPPEVLYAGVENNRTVKLVFNRFVDRNSLGPVRLDGRKLMLLPADDKSSGSPNDSGDSTDLQTGSMNPKKTNRVADAVFTFRSTRNIQKTYQMVTVSSVTDVAGRTRQNTAAPLAFPPDPGDLIINEIMYQPVSDRYSSHPDQSEYLEIKNRSPVPVQLFGVHIHDQPDKNGMVQKLRTLQKKHETLEPDEYAVFYADTSQIFEYSRIFRAFSIPSESANNFYRVDRQTLGFSTQGDEVYVSDRNGLVIDSLWYQPGWHNPNLIDTRGFSLERISTGAETMNRNNWTSATIQEGGTPGYQNSVTVKSISKIPSGLLLRPNPFSPSGDGSDDHLMIHYSLEHPDYLMHVRIFDRQGRLVRTVADGERAGRSGKLIWDGRTENGIMNRTGLYIIHFKAIDPSGGGDRIFREIAVLAAP